MGIYENTYLNSTPNKKSEEINSKDKEKSDKKPKKS